MQVTGVTANLPVSDIEAARGFYVDYLGLGVEEMNLGWVARYRSMDGRASLQLVSRDASSSVDSVLSVHVGDGVDEAYAEAQRRGYEIAPVDRGVMGRPPILRARPGRQRHQRCQSQ